MKFVCDSCHAQYMISDDKVGPNGVKVRCKKCSHVIVVKKVTEAVSDATIVMQNPMAGSPATVPSADTPFGNLELDEIGQAFDSVLSSGPQPRLPNTEESSAPDMAASGTGGTSGSEDRSATRVMDLAAMAGLANSTESSSGDNTPDAIKAGLGGPASSTNGHSNGAAGSSGLAAPVPQTDWYVAINEEQIGPLDLDVVKGHWEEGRLTTDSLVWRNGYPDWRPLSTVADLVKVLTPVPTKRKQPEPPPEAPAGATASGPQMPWQASSPAPPPAAVPDPDAVDWKPAAASALASLVQDEMEALAKPPPKKEEPPPPEPKPRGLLDVEEAPPPPVLSPSPASSMAPSSSALSAESPTVERPPVEEERPRPAPVARRAPPPRVEPDIPVYPSPATYVPPRPEGGNTKWIVIGLASLAVCATVITVAYMFSGKTPAQPVAETRDVPRPAAPVQQPSAPPPPVQQPVVAQPAPAPSAPPVVPAATPTPAPAAPAQVAAAQVKAPPPAAAPTRAEEREERRGKKGHHRSDKGGGGNEEVVASSDAPPEKHAAAAAPEAPSAPASDNDLLAGGGNSKVNQDFDRLLGGNGAAKSDDAPAPKKAKGGSTYIPPAVGADLPDQLGKGDIMGVVAGHKSNILICVGQQKAKDPDASGSVLMHWQIQPSGATTAVACKTDEFKNGPMATCMTNQIRSWKFPQFKGAPMPIDFPFKF